MQKFFVASEGKANIGKSENMTSIHIGRLLCISKLSDNLLAVLQLSDEGYDVQFNKDSCKIIHDVNNVSYFH